LKNLSFVNRIVFFLNNIVALLFFVSLTLPYIAPKSFPLLSIMSLTVPMLLFAHLIFIIYWLLSGIKRQFLLSFLCIALAIGLSFFPYKFNSKEVVSGSSFAVMNFNVRRFNVYDWIDSDKVPQEISSFIKKEDPELIAFQEYAKDKRFDLTYPYKYEKLNGGKRGNGLAIFSKFRIVNRGSLDFENSNNNAIFIDIIRSNDTIRIYNVHLESFGIKPDSVDLNLDEKRSKKLIYRLKKSFSKQQDQVEKFLDHKKSCHYKTIISGDFNNTAFSWAYRNLKGDLNDSFIEAGKGFGKTYPFNSYPLRIDFILSDKKFKVNQHKNFEIGLSDHEPVLARLSY